MNLVNKEVREKLYEMVGHGVTSVSEMRRHLKVYVDTQLFPSASKPSLTDAAYYPSDVTIRIHIYLAQLRLRYEFGTIKKTYIRTGTFILPLAVVKKKSVTIVIQ